CPRSPPGTVPPRARAGTLRPSANVPSCACRGKGRASLSLLGRSWTVRGDLVDGALADVLDPVAHPLQVMRDPQEPGRAIDRGRVFGHVLEELAVDDV